MERKITVKEWCEQYLAERESGWSDVTRNSYRCIVGRHIVPGMGRYQLEQLTTQRIQKFYQRLAKEGLGGYSVQCVHLLLRRCLNEACRKGLIPQNPVKSCVVPPYVGLTSGLRQKELLSLKRSDFDGRGRIYKGKRLLAIDPKAMRLLRNEYSRHPDREEVFPNPKTGQPYLLHEFYYLHQKILKSARLHPISFRELARNRKGVEDLRHTFAVHSLQSGAKVKGL